MQQETVNIISEWIAVTLLNGVWGGLLLVVVLWLGVKCMSHVRPINASTRYVIWVSGLVLCIALIGWQGVRSMPESLFQPLGAESQQEEPAVAEVVTPSADEVEPVKHEVVIIDSPDVNSHKAVAVDPDVAVAVDIDANTVVAADANVQTEPVAIYKEEATSWGLKERLPEAVYSYSIGTPPPFVLTSVSVIWVVLCGLLLLRLLYSGVLVFRIKRKAASPSPLIKQVLSDWSRSIKGARSVEVGVSNSIKSAVAVGYMHPMILLPEPMLTALDRSEVEHVVLHELAHIRRFDDWTILLQQFARAVFFFHPAIWILSRLMNQDREIACDDWVVSLSKKPKKYASCLAKIASMRIAGHAPIAVAPATSSKKQLFIRVRSILNRKLSDSCKVSGKVYGIMVLIAIGLITSITYIAPVIAFAENSPPLEEHGEEDAPKEVVADLGTVYPSEGLVVTGNVVVSDDGVEAEPVEILAEEPTREVAAEVNTYNNVQPVSPAGLLLDTAVQSEIVPVNVQGNTLEIAGDVLKGEEQDTTNNQVQVLSEKSMILWLSAVSRISSPGEKKSLLVKASYQLPESDEVHIAFINAARSISTPSDKAESLVNLLIRSNLGAEGTLRLLEATRSLSSSNDRFALYSSLLIQDERFLLEDERVRQALKSGIESIKTNRHYEAILSTYLRVERELKDR